MQPTEITLLPVLSVLDTVDVSSLSDRGGEMAVREMYELIATEGLRRKKLGRKNGRQLLGYLKTKPLARLSPGDILARLVFQDSVTVFFKKIGASEFVEITRVS